MLVRPENINIVANNLASIRLAHPLTDLLHSFVNETVDFCLSQIGSKKYAVLSTKSSNTTVTYTPSGGKHHLQPDADVFKRLSFFNPFSYNSRVYIVHAWNTGYQIDVRNACVLTHSRCSPNMAEEFTLTRGRTKMRMREAQVTAVRLATLVRHSPMPYPLSENRCNVVPIGRGNNCSST